MLTDSFPVVYHTTSPRFPKVLSQLLPVLIRLFSLGKEEAVVGRTVSLGWNKVACYRLCPGIGCEAWNRTVGGGTCPVKTTQSTCLGLGILVVWDR